MKTRFFLHFFILIGAASLTLNSCSPSSKVTNLSHIHLQSDPKVTSFQDPDVDFEKFRTFTVLPSTNDATRENPILAKQLAFYLRNVMEYHGYKFVAPSENPDIIATMDVKSEYHETYIPPQTISVPVYIPGKTITIESNSKGTASAFSDDEYAYGNYSGTSSSTINVPGSMAMGTKTIPGQTVGHYYPILSVWLYGGNKKENIWLGTGVGVTDLKDTRLSCQPIMNVLHSKIPYNPSLNSDTVNIGYIGMSYFVTTPDGNRFYPFITGVSGGTPADEAGIEYEDAIIMINGTPTENLPLSKISELLKGNVGEAVSFKIWRVGKAYDFTVTRKSREAVYKKKN